MMDLLSSCGEHWLDLMWKVTWQGGVFIAVIFLITRIFRRLSPTIKHLLWMLVIVKFLVMPFVVIPISLPGLPITVREPIVETSDLRPQTGVIPESSPTLLTEQLPATTEVSRARVVGQWPSILFSVWIFGVLVLLMGIIYRSLKLKRDIAAAKVLEDPTVLQIVGEGAKQLRIKPPLLKVSGRSRSPLACGILRPTLIFPEHIIEKLSQSELRAIINHELAHIKRLDILTNWFQITTQVFYFFNPLVWYVNRRIRLEREQACDDWVLEITKEDRKRYVDALVKVVELCSKQRGFALGIVGVSEPFTLMARRLKMVMDTGRKIRTRLSVRMIIGLILVGLIGIPGYAKRESEMEKIKEAVSPANVTMEFVIAGVKHTESLLEDVKVGFTIDSQVSNGRRGHLDVFEMWKGDMVFRTFTAEVDGELMQPETTMIFDGKRTIVGTVRGFWRTYVDVQQGNTLEPHFTPRRLCWDFTTDNNKMKGLELSRLLSKGEFSAREELFEGRKRYVVEGTYQGEYFKSPRHYRFHIDPSRGFSVVRMEMEGTALHYDEVELKEVTPGVWFPMHARWKLGRPHPLAGTISEFSVTRVEVNSNLTNDDFRFNRRYGILSPLTRKW